MIISLRNGSRSLRARDFRRRIVVWIVLPMVVLCFAACSTTGIFDERDPGNNLIEYQFLNGDTMKPIAGVYVNAIWVTPTPPGMANGSQCVQAALLRSDASGWVRMDGPRGSILEVPRIFAPGHEPLSLSYELEPVEQSVHVLSVYRRVYDQYPAWGWALQEMGYQLIDRPENTNVQFRKNYDSIPKNRGRWFPAGAQRYYVSVRSYPGETSVVNVANMCGPEGRNIGLSDAARAETGTRRALHQLNLICDEKWDSALGDYPGHLLPQVLWLVEEPKDSQAAWEKLRSVLPSYQGDSPMTRNERIVFCEWMRPYAEKYQ